MAKIAVTGAGSLAFTRTLVGDLIQQEATSDAEIHLVDINARRLREIGQVVQAMVDSRGCFRAACSHPPRRTRKARNQRPGVA